METYAGNDVELLVDDEMEDAIVQALRRARSTVDLTQLLFFPEFVGRFHRSGPFARPQPERPLLEEFLDAARRGAQVRILLNQNAVIPDTVRRVALACAGEPRVEVRGLALALNLLHAKVLVADDEAFLIGPPFEQRFWDTRRHSAREPRRGEEPPMHDLSLRLRGPVVAGVARFFEDLWGASGGEAYPSSPASRLISPVSPGQTVGLARTMPARTVAREGDRGILDAYLDAIARAREFVYLETQYFTSPTIGRALAEALAREPRLQAILLVNGHMDIPGYDAWQGLRAAELGHPVHPRLGMFTLTSYVHSKLAVVDDDWATLGSANLDSISLEMAEEFGLPTEPNVDVNAVLTDRDWIASARRRVWAEHLGDEGVWRADPPPGGWLALWRRCAEANAERRDSGRRLRGFVLPYEPRPVLRL